MPPNILLSVTFPFCLIVLTCDAFISITHQKCTLAYRNDLYRNIPNRSCFESSIGSSCIFHFKPNIHFFFVLSVFIKPTHDRFISQVFHRRNVLCTSHLLLYCASSHSICIRESWGSPLQDTQASICMSEYFSVTRVTRNNYGGLLHERFTARRERQQWQIAPRGLGNQTETDFNLGQLGLKIY